MENKNTGLKVLIIVLTILVVALSGYIVYDKVLSDKTIQEENQNNNINNEQEIEKITEEKIKEIFDFVYDYIEIPSVYCGEYEYAHDLRDEMPMYVLSKQYSTYNEMINDLKRYMSIDVISNGLFASTNKEYYIEKNGKLYCEEMYKGYPYGQGNIDIEIISQSENKIECIATMELTDMSNNKTYDKVDIVLEKNDDNWLVTKYIKQNTELR